MITTNLLISLLLILVAAWFLGSLFYRFGLPFVLGELLAGVILGPPLLGLIGPSHAIELLAELGIFFVMFHTGMEMDPRELVENIWPSLAVAAGGFVQLLVDLRLRPGSGARMVLRGLPLHAAGL